MAGVSRSTVSRVVNGGQSVRPDVRSRVEGVIHRTGYTPHAAARSLVSNRTGVVGLVIPSRVHDLFEDPYFPRLIQGLTLASNRAGTTVSLFLFETEEEERRLSPRVLEAGSLDGVIITATRMGDPLLERLAASDMPLVVIGRPDHPGVNYVDVDNRHGAMLAARRLVAGGHATIGMIAAPLETTAGLDRLDGFVAGLAESDRSLPSHLRIVADFTETGGYHAMHALVAHGVDAVFVASDTMALGALRAARALDLVVPRDLAIVGFDGFQASEHAVPPLTTVRQPVAETAARAVDVLRRLIDGELDRPVSEVLPVALIERDTTTPLDDPPEHRPPDHRPPDHRPPADIPEDRP